MITDALSQDSRILEVDDFEINFSDDKMHVSFKITTVYGETIIEYTL
ncbi:MAG: hypothetical protein IJA12_06885 [Oscillospiraceae bacterium]|nr:hypothetical protein [Oscillospiraceae bacterium]